MDKKILTAVSILALTGASAAFADSQVKANAEVTTGGPGSKTAAEQSTGDFGKDVENAWEDIKQDSSETFNNIKATVIGEDRGDFKAISIDERMTASGMIGQPVYNLNKEKIATIKDVILDQNGKANMVIVSDGEFIGLGKKAAFDYGAIARVNADGDVIMPLTEQMIDSAAEFSYDEGETEENVRVIPANGYSVAELLDGQLVDQNNKSVGEIDNITFKNGSAAQLIVGFDKILGMGGEKAALSFDGSNVVKDGDSYDYRLSAEQTARFKAYKDQRG